MKSFILNIYRNTKFGLFLHKCYWFPRFKYLAFIQYLSSLPRQLGYKDKRFLPLLQYKNKYSGKRCFITCTGPSLTIEDLELLKNEYVFGMNSICLVHNETEWVPDFYGIQDVKVFDKINDTLLSTDNGQVFAPYSYVKTKNTPKYWVYWHHCGAYHLYEYRFTDKLFAKFSPNAYAKIYDGYTITYSIMQLAIYMGFDELYLLGADCSYLGEKLHFIDTGVRDLKAETAGDRMLTAYALAKEYADSHGIKIYNATRGGCLELFPRVKLEDVLANNEKNKTCE